MCCAFAFLAVCIFGRLFRRGTFNAAFSAVGLFLVGWEVVGCGYNWPILCSLFAAFLFGSGDASERPTLKVD